ncbi:glucose-6-phosphate dehydrogenase, partial [Emiliania huxleyi CCMP1516]|uniref:glucose-6-phosphate dehydrogenase (NADP(+)) n=2 Tax=Emiliania huxleyi TaxID=2903 RepID=A0A0D3ISD8_EMIH1
SVVVFGADGDLASKKILPTLFNLWRRKLVPRDLLVFGFARAPMTTETFRKHIFKCVYHPSQPQGDRKEFLQRCHYQSGQFDEPEAMEALLRQREEAEAARLAARQQPAGSRPQALHFQDRRPASASFDAVGAAAEAGVPEEQDTASCQQMVRELSMLREDEIFRIDHYLGKELVMNLLVLRFANVCFQGIWNRQYIKNVQVIFKEDFGTQGRRGGWVARARGVRHLCHQVMALVAMEQPLSFSAGDIRAEKLKVLKCVQPLTLDTLCTGQYVRCGNSPGYLEEPTVVDKQSRTETFAAAVLHVHNPRWEGVPFVLKAGKALTDRKAEVRIQFHNVPGVISDLANSLPANELVVRLQPEETIYWKVQNKVPGLGFETNQIRMDLLYATKFQQRKLPEARAAAAYERLLLDVLAGQSSNFVSAEELIHSWAIFTPVLHQLREEKVVPEPYPYGSRGPPGADELASR